MEFCDGGEELLLPPSGNLSCGNATTGAGRCPEGYTCLQGFGPNPDSGFTTSFDNIGWAMLQGVMMLKVVDFWEAVYQQVLRGAGHFHKIYFTLIMFLCSFYCLALTIGVFAFTIFERVNHRQGQPEPATTGFLGKCIHWQTGSHSHLDHRKIPNKMKCVSNSFTWENPTINFDHTRNTFLSLFMVATYKGWIGIMNGAIDSREHDDQPHQEASLQMYAYFLHFTIIEVFLFLSLLVAKAVIQLDQQSKAETVEGLTLFMNRVQLKVAAFRKLRAGRKVKNVRTTAAQKTGQASKWFDLGVAVMMTCYLIIVASDHYNLSESWHFFYYHISLVFMAAITAEACLKIVSLQRHYFSEPSNLFDMSVATLELIMSEVGMVTLAMTPFCLLRGIKVIVFYLVKERRGMRTLLNTIRNSFRQVISASMVLFLLICSYSLFGMLVFQHVKLRGALDETIDFQTFHQVFFFMFQLTTGAGWDGVLAGLSDEDDCYLPDPDQADPLLAYNNCGDSTLAIPFLLSFLFLTFSVVAYMFLTVILQYISEAIQDDVETMEDVLANFDHIWEGFDPISTGLIRQDQLSSFLELLQPPLQIRKPNESEITSLGIIVKQDDKLNCEDVFSALVKRHFVVSPTNT